MKKGFTLSEVLITLSIVGVVAVLTVPGVMKNYKNKMYTAQLQKAYGKIAQAAQLAMNDDRVDNFSETKAAAQNACTKEGDEPRDKWKECTHGPKYFLHNYFKNIKEDCIDTCMIDKYPTIASDSTFSFHTNREGYVCAQTVDGASICMREWKKTNHQSYRTPDIYIDVNGIAEPNIAGRDLFSMNIEEDGTIVDNNKNGETTIECRNQGECGCLQEIIEKGWIMEY